MGFNKSKHRRRRTGAATPQTDHSEGSSATTARTAPPDRVADTEQTKSASEASAVTPARVDADEAEDGGSDEMGSGAENSAEREMATGPAASDTAEGPARPAEAAVPAGPPVPPSASGAKADDGGVEKALAPGASRADDGPAPPPQPPDAPPAPPADDTRVNAPIHSDSQLSITTSQAQPDAAAASMPPVPESVRTGSPHSEAQGAAAPARSSDGRAITSTPSATTEGPGKPAASAKSSSGAGTTSSPTSSSTVAAPADTGAVAERIIQPFHIALFTVLLLAGTTFAIVVLNFTTDMGWMWASVRVLRKLAKGLAFRQTIALVMAIAFVRYGLEPLMRTVRSVFTLPGTWERSNEYFFLKQACLSTSPALAGACTPLTRLCWLHLVTTWLLTYYVQSTLR